jgi:uncharacterized spore protein YtfJ
MPPREEPKRAKSAKVPVARPERAGRAARTERGGVRGLRRVLDRVTGAHLCYGEPVRAGEHTVIPVARVVASGGWGYGRGGERGGDEGVGQGGGGHLDARPAGFIEVGPGGARYVAIPDPDQLARTLRAGAAALVTLSGAAALRRRRGPAGLLGRSH